MSKKKPSPPEESSDLFGTQPRKKSVRKGRPPVLPKGFEAYMDDLMQHSEGMDHTLQGGLVHGSRTPV